MSVCTYVRSDYPAKRGCICISQVVSQAAWQLHDPPCPRLPPKQPREPGERGHDRRAEETLGALKRSTPPRPSNLFRFFLFFSRLSRLSRLSRQRNYLWDRARDSYTLDPNPFRVLRDTRYVLEACSITRCIAQKLPNRQSNQQPMRFLQLHLVTEWFMRRSE